MPKKMNTVEGHAALEEGTWEHWMFDRRDL